MLYTPAAVQLLLRAKTKVDARDQVGRTPLSWAAFFGHPDVVRRLLQAGAKVYARDKEGKTPLRLAAQKGHSKVVELLAAVLHEEARRNQAQAAGKRRDAEGA